MTVQDATADKIIDAAFSLIQEQGTWRGVRLEQVADAAEVGLDALFDRFPGKAHITRGFADRIDRQLLADTDAEDREEPIRDRLFDLFIRRFDLLDPHHGAIRIIAKEAGGGTPMDLALDGCLLLRSISWTLEAGGVSTSGLIGAARVKVMTALYLHVARIWIETDDNRSAKVEAELDKALKRAESLQESLPVWLKSTVKPGKPKPTDDGNVATGTEMPNPT